MTRPWMQLSSSPSSHNSHQGLEFGRGGLLGAHKFRSLLAVQAGFGAQVVKLPSGNRVIGWF